jgi:hypothetical protein
MGRGYYDCGVERGPASLQENAGMLRTLLAFSQFF